MRKIFGDRALRFVFLANVISMMGSGLNSAAVTWHILQATKTEVNLAILMVLQTLPSMLLLPFSGVVIDREDRRRLVMILDAGRGVVILCVAVLALLHRAELWHLYVMNILVAAGFWMFWPTITALIQELTPESEFIHSNTFLMAGVQGGWLIAGAIVGFLYNHIGLGGILLIDFATYVASFSLYFSVRRGRHVAERPAQQPHIEVQGAVSRYVHEMQEGWRYVRHRPEVIILGAGWALFLGAMLTQSVITAPLSDRVLLAGAVGYGWLNGGWGVGAFLSALYAPKFIKKFPGRASICLSMGLLAFGMFAAPFSHWVTVAVFLFFLMGSARGIGGITLNSTMMELVPNHMMGRVQNTFYFMGMLLQLVLGLSVGLVAHRYSLTTAFALVAVVYTLASVMAILPTKHTVEIPTSVGT